MSNVAIVYWSGTGNTEQMAEAVKTGASDAGATVSVFTASEFDEGKMDEFDSVAFGCPAMGSEELEEAEFAPMFDACKSKLKDKKIALFGSYSWADGEWMRLWESECKDLGAVLAAEPVICFEAPDDDGVSDCKALGAALV